MITSAHDRKQTIRVTDGNIRNNHISVAGLRGFIPKSCFGSQGGKGQPIRIQLDGLKKTVETDIACDAKTGKAKRQFRARGWVREFFKYHAVKPGDELEFGQAGCSLAGAYVRPS